MLGSNSPRERERERERKRGGGKRENKRMTSENKDGHVREDAREEVSNN